MKLFTENNIWQLLRLTMSFIFLWAFFDKLLGLGFATKASGAWINGTSPTAGFLAFAPEGPLADIFKTLSGSIIVDTLFMAGLLLVGLSLLLGIGLKIAGYAGSLLMFLIYLSLFPPVNNPLIDDHIIYILVLLGLTIRGDTQNFGLSDKWTKLKLVKKYPILK